MATLRGARGQQGGTPWGWIIGIIAVVVATAAIMWWLRAGAPPADTTGQQGVEERSDPATDQPGLQPGTQTPPGGTPPGGSPP